MAVFEIIREALFGKHLVGCRGMIPPQLAVLPASSENRDFILDLNHQNGSGLGIDGLDVLHESAKCGHFSFDDGVIVVRNGVMVSDTVGIDRSRVGLLIADYVEWGIELPRQVSVYVPIPARIVTKPIQDVLQAVLLSHGLRVIDISEIEDTLFRFHHRPFDRNFESIQPHSPGPKTAAIAAFAFWFIGPPHQTFILTYILQLPTSVFVSLVAVTLVMLIAGTVVGARPYKE